MPTKIAYISITVVVLVLLPKLLLLLELLVLVLLLVLVFAVFTVLVWSVRTTLLLTPKPPGICASSSIGTGIGTIAGADDVVATIVAAGASLDHGVPRSCGHHRGRRAVRRRSSMPPHLQRHAVGEALPGFAVAQRRLRELVVAEPARPGSV